MRPQNRLIIRFLVSEQLLIFSLLLSRFDKLYTYVEPYNNSYVSTCVGLYESGIVPLYVQANKSLHSLRTIG